jgi:hypothetical protein
LFNKIFEILFKKSRSEIHIAIVEQYKHTVVFGNPRLSLVIIKIINPNFRNMLFRFNKLKIIEAYLNGDLEIEGDLVQCINYFSKIKLQFFDKCKIVWIVLINIFKRNP